MNIPLDQFEQHIDATILERGYRYYHSGAVEKPDLVKRGQYEAIVHGSADYKVTLTIDKAVVTNHYCSCPYDFGPICKHVAAVLFYMQQDGLKIKPAPKKKSKPRKKRKSIADQVDDLIKELSKAEFSKFFKQLTEEDTGLAKRFLASFAYLQEEESKALYAKQIKTILNGAKRQGFIDWHNARQVGDSLYRLMGTAEEHLKEGRSRSAFYMAFAVLEEMTLALDFMDDSNADAGTSIDRALGVLADLAQQKLEEGLRTEFYEQCLTDFNKKLFSGWGWHLDMLDFASNLSRFKAESENVLAHFHKTSFSRYEWEGAEVFKMTLIAKIDGAVAALDYMWNHLENSRLRKMALEKLMDEGDYERAEKVVLEGIEQDKNDKPGLARMWQDWQLRIAISAGESEKVIHIARQLIVSNNARDVKEYHTILKSHVPPKEWPQFLTKLITDMKPSWNNLYTIADFYVDEGWFEKLFGLAKKFYSIEFTKKYEQYLVKDYKTEVATIYDNRIRGYLKDNVGRSNYKQAVRYIRWLVKLGEKERVEGLLIFLRKEYANRPALMDELSKL